MQTGLKRGRTADAEASEEEPDTAMHPEDQLTQCAARLIQTHAAFIPDKGGADGILAEQIARTAAGAFQCKEQGIVEGKGSVLLIVDPASMAESSSHPHLRKAQIPQQMIERVVNTGFIARSMARTNNKEPDAGELLGPDDVWLLFDGGRQVDNLLTKPFRRATKKQKLEIKLSYDEESYLTNIGRVSCMGCLKCTESMHLMASDTWRCARRVHAHYKGSNYGDQLGPIIYEDWEKESVWKLSRKMKKSLMGRFRIEAGGSVDPGLSATSKWKTREEEPVWFHQKPYLLCDDSMHS